MFNGGWGWGNDGDDNGVGDGGHCHGQCQGHCQDQGHQHHHHHHHEQPQVSVSVPLPPPDPNRQRVASPITIEAPCIYNAIVDRLYDGSSNPKQGHGHGQQKIQKAPTARPRPRPNVISNNSRRTCPPIQYYVCKPLKPKRITEARTGSVFDHGTGNYKDYGSISRAEELSLKLGRKNLIEKALAEANGGGGGGNSRGSPPDDSQKDGGPPDSSRSDSQGTQRFVKNKELDKPQLNSIKLQGNMIQKAIWDLSAIPSEVKRVLDAQPDTSEVKQRIMKQATKKLNVQPSTKIYSNLVDLDVIPEVTLKKVPVVHKKVDPSPNIEEILKPQYVKARPSTSVYSRPHPKKGNHHIDKSLEHEHSSDDYEMAKLERLFMRA